MELAVSGTPQHATKMDKCNFHETNADDSSCSSSSTISCPAEMAETGCHGQTLSNKNSSNSLQMRQRNRLIFFWSNFVLIITLVIGILICLAAYFCLGNTEVLEEKTNGHINKGNLALVFTMANGLAFLNVAILILCYTCYIQRIVAQDTSEYQAVKSNAMLRALFPSNVARIETRIKKKRRIKPSELNDTYTSSMDDSLSRVEQISNVLARPVSLKQFLNKQKLEGAIAASNGNGKHIAELFTETTIMFADIEGFTAWSSVREPSQVFTLLESLFSAFDDIAARRSVFKVETVGDCYVAVCGLPDPRKDHAVVMARFARDCLRKMRPLCKQLELTLGPDTGDLNIRIGLHSGPVTGGVLKGECRLQLFGDTVNTAARMEQTGQGGQVHLSHHTKDLLVAAGKSSWLTARPTKVIAKGKGAMETYFLHIRSDANSSVSDTSGNCDDSDVESDERSAAPTATTCSSPASEDSSPQKARLSYTTKITSAKKERLVQWNCDILRRLLKQIVARRQYLIDANPGRKADADERVYVGRQVSLVHEVKESISMPSFDYSTLVAEQANSIELDPKIDEQLVDFVRKVAAMYTDNPFHSFEHASHVSMSVAKLLSRIIAPTESDFGENETNLHDHTFGITSDPLTQFACVLSALIHDADHPGVPNAQLVKEQTALADAYDGQSIAEQHSVHACWDLLMQHQYSDLRRTIYTTHAGLERFRSLVVNSVMATDICDKELKELRNNRWAKAFSDCSQDEDEKTAKDRKATIVIEHLIQASDVAHTMQHWHIYRKWNEKLFWECYKAFKEGRAEKNPIEYWYKGEIGFYDFYVIPLAKKLKECGVFGVSSDEYLNYALRNREEWEHKGQEVVEELIGKVEAMEAEAREEDETKATSSSVAARTA